MAARVCHDDYVHVGPKRCASVWAIMTRQARDLTEFTTDAAWMPVPVDAGPVWTDDFSNVVGTLQLGRAR